MEEVVEEIGLKLNRLGFDASALSASLSSLSPSSHPFSSLLGREGGSEEQDLEILSWLSDSMGAIIEDDDLQGDVVDDFGECDCDNDDDDDDEGGEEETILEERLQQLELQYAALSRAELPPVRMSEDKYRRSRKEKSLQCQEAARNFGDAVHEFLAAVKEFRPTDMNDKQINEYFAREEEFTRCIREWVRSKLGDMPHKREDDLESRQATIRLLNRTLSLSEAKTFESEMRRSELESESGGYNEKELADAKGELENLTGKVIPVLREGYELLETLPAVVADCEEEVEEMAYSAAVLEQGISFMMEQLARCFLFELLLEEKALRGDMQVSILTHVMEKELLAAKLEYEQWKIKNGQESRKLGPQEISEVLPGTRTATVENPIDDDLDDLDGREDPALEQDTVFDDARNRPSERESRMSYGRLRPWIRKLEAVLFDEYGRLCTKQNDLEGILSEAEAKTKELNELVTQMERDYHAEKDALKCDGIRSFERNLWIDFFANPEKLKEIVGEAQKALLEWA